VRGNAIVGRGVYLYKDSAGNIRECSSYGDGAMEHAGVPKKYYGACHGMLGSVCVCEY